MPQCQKNVFFVTYNIKFNWSEAILLVERLISLLCKGASSGEVHHSKRQKHASKWSVPLTTPATPTTLFVQLFAITAPTHPMACLLRCLSPGVTTVFLCMRQSEVVVSIDNKLVANLIKVSVP